jgi:PAS domain S-box-containing protein
MAARMAAFDWSASLLGPVRTWPQSLRTAVGICLSSRYPMVIWWGPHLVLLYNDAWVPILGPEKHPALGRPGIDVSPEIWHIIGRQLYSVLQTGEATFSENQLLPAMRFGYLEEAYFTYSYSAIRDESGAVGGVFTAVSETTQRVLSERRLRLLRGLGESTALAATRAGANMASVCAAALQTLADDRADIPFAVVYAWEPGEPAGRLVAAMGVSERPVLEGPGASPGSAWWDAVRRGAGMVLKPLPAEWGRGVQPGANSVGDAPPTTAVILPVQVGGQDEPAAVLVAGVTPYRNLDDDFRGFFDLVAAQISRAVSDAESYQTQRRRAEALAELDRAKSEFFANVSHEFRTPLTLIAGPAQDGLDDGGEPLGPAQRQRMEVIRRNAGRLGRLVDDMLDFARIEAGKRQPEREPVDLAVATHELCASFAPAVERAGLVLRTDIQPLPGPMAVDAGMWEKVVLNLLSNAVKYTLAGHIEVGLRENYGVVTFSVRDTGIGIPSQELPRVFERFHRIRGRAARSHEGAGIGLALVAELVRLHDGSVTVESEEGVGSTFTVRLPYRASDFGVPAAPRVDRNTAYVDEALQWSPPDTAPAGAQAVPAHDASVLVVEDNPDMRAFISELLTPYWRVLQAPDGREGLALARKHRPDLVLTDVMMPHLDGFGLLAELRGDPRTASMPVVFLSARADVEAAVGGLAAGADDYLPKPFSTVELLARVRSNLEMARFRNRESEFRRALVDSMQEGFFLTDGDGTIVESNHSLFELTGFDPAGVPYPWPQPWVPARDSDPQGWSINESAFAQCRRDGGGYFTLPFRHRDGHTVWVACSAAMVTDPHSSQRLFVGTLRDVTAERLTSQRDAVLSGFAAALAGDRWTTTLLTHAAEQLRTVFNATGVVAAQWTGNVADPMVISLPAPAPDHLLAVVETARHQPAAAVISRTTDRDTVLLAAPLDATGAAAIGMELHVAEHALAENQHLFGSLTSHLAQALVGAREYEQTRAVALTLQHAILGPTQLPHGFAVRYTPAVEPLEVGGDWYDVIGLDDDRIGVVVGDCVGRGLPAAAVMGQLRSAAQALLLRTSAPGQALTALDSFAQRVPAAVCTTVFCAVIDVANSTVCYSSAGHPPPIAVAADGSERFLDQAQSLPLAATKTARPRREGRITLAPGTTLLAYTDGLIERRRESLTDGVKRAAEALKNERHRHPDQLADYLMKELAPPAGYDDDVAVLLYRHPPPALHVELPALTASLAPMRAQLRDWLTGAAVDPETAVDIILAVGEAASNAVEHAGHRASHPVDLAMTARITGVGLRLVVADNGCWRPPAAEPGYRGHGISLMKALVDTVDIKATDHGTTVDLLKELHA